MKVSRSYSSDIGWWVALSSLLVLPSQSQSLNIAPNGTGFIDASGLGPGLDFYDFDNLTIQLTRFSPVWTIQNTRSTDTHFVGLSEDGEISCDLMRYIDGQYSVLTARCIDRQFDTWYEIRPDALGNDRTDIVGRKSGFAEGPQFAEPLRLSWRDLWRSFSSANIMAEYAKQQWNSLFSSWNGRDDTKIAMIDVMVVWSENSECARSFLEIDCQLTERTRVNMKGAIEAVILDTNVIHNNSNAGVLFSLVYADRDTSGYRETSSTQTLRDLAVPLVDGQLNYIQKLRNEYKADLVSFVLDIRLDSEFLGGMALAINIPGFPAPTVPLCFLAYSCFSPQRMFDWAYVPAHEWGHVMGCHHDRGTVDVDGLLPGFACKDKTDYAYGHRSPTGTFRTIMAYPCQPGQCDNYQDTGGFCYAIPYWSGDASYKNGESLGGHDNRCRDEIKKNGKAISRYR